jgi:hypothetical protein
MKIKLKDLRKVIAEETKKLHEAGPDEMRVDWEVVSRAIESKLDDTLTQSAGNFVYKMRTEVVAPRIGKILNQHGIGHGVGRGAYSFAGELEDFDAVGIQTAEMECVTDIVAALTKYAQDLGQLAVHMHSGQKEPYEIRGDAFDHASGMWGGK